MHLYQSGIPLSYIKDFLGHVSVNITDIYASTDTSMMKAALGKIDQREGDQISKEVPIWQDNEELILKHMRFEMVRAGRKYYYPEVF